MVIQKTSDFDASGLAAAMQKRVSRNSSNWHTAPAAGRRRLDHCNDRQNFELADTLVIDPNKIRTNLDPP
jgi:hypothetical protein